MEKYPNINPIQLRGNWKSGWALDRHTVSSQLIGYDPSGKEQFDTKRTEMGQLVNELKYWGYDNVSQIMDLATPFLNDWQAIDRVNMVIHAPHTKKRLIQPAEAIAEAVAIQYRKPFFKNALIKLGGNEAKSKDYSDLIEDIDIDSRITMTCELRVLLVDDIYDLGRTLKACTKTLLEMPNITEVYVLTMTKKKALL